MKRRLGPATCTPKPRRATRLSNEATWTAGRQGVSAGLTTAGWPGVGPGPPAATTGRPLPLALGGCSRFPLAQLLHQAAARSSGFARAAGSLRLYGHVHCLQLPKPGRAGPGRAGIYRPKLQQAREPVRDKAVCARDAVCSAASGSELTLLNSLTVMNCASLPSKTHQLGPSANAAAEAHQNRRAVGVHGRRSRLTAVHGSQALRVLQA